MSDNNSVSWWILSSAFISSKISVQDHIRMYWLFNLNEFENSSKGNFSLCILLKSSLYKETFLNDGQMKTNVPFLSKRFK